ncbi:AraC-like DNA-binding protein [Tamilnaduibacter salinus]|uniref:AraC-like DNA-binding protein n=1 Tax=Tamilnaduibacter salinus TaxID=1484056 RepID=A0A2U1CYQ1_9GAMM|nr:AraC family transcriptional regulator [Tamilnaduibacter salinus]PVY77547.1 AraC-like DNA-binding protein [Tamilnaduibacter salinus]
MPTDHPTSKTYLLILLSQSFAPAERILEGTGLARRDVDTLDAVDFSTVQTVVRNVERYSNDPAWPAKLGSRVGITSHGTVGFAALSAPSVGQALTTFVRWEPIRTPGYRATTREQNGQIAISVRDTTGDPTYHRAFCLIFLRGLETLIGAIINQPCQGQTTLALPGTPANARRALAEEFESTLDFPETGDFTLRVPKHLWTRPSPLSDPEAHRLNLQKCEQIVAERDSTATLDLILQTLLRQHFEQNVSDRGEPVPPPTSGQMADRLHLSERTLIRRLKSLGTSYRALIEESRQNTAAHLLTDARYRVADIADLLGYQTPSNFSRAFSRWFGVSPGRFRLVSRRANSLTH